jgi:hypothetical protein
MGLGSVFRKAISPLAKVHQKTAPIRKRARARVSGPFRDPKRAARQTFRTVLRAGTWVVPGLGIALTAEDIRKRRLEASRARRRATHAEEGIRREVVRTRRNIDLLLNQHGARGKLQIVSPFDKTLVDQPYQRGPRGSVPETALFPQAQLGPGGPMGSSGPEHVAEETGDLDRSEGTPTPGSAGRTLAALALTGIALMSSTRG